MEYQNKYPYNISFGLMLSGLNTQSAEATAAAAAAGLLPPMNIQSLAALAAMTQQSIPNATTAQQGAPLTNALLCKFLFLFCRLDLEYYFALYFLHIIVFLRVFLYAKMYQLVSIYDLHSLFCTFVTISALDNGFILHSRMHNTAHDC